MSAPPSPPRHPLDGGQLAVLAHPLRLRLVAALRLHGPATATQLATRLGSNSGKTSYHLRQLERVGLVAEDTARGNARDRWWHAVHSANWWNPADHLEDPDAVAATDWLAGHVTRLHAQWAERFVQSRPEWSRAWIDASTLSDYQLRLSPDRLRDLAEELFGVVERYRDDARGTAEDDEIVTVTIHAFPNPEPLT